jgi:F-type H+-transporting ATPase subunit a
VSTLLAAGGGFEAPSTADFWQPLFGTDGPFAITRASVVILLSALAVSGLLLAATKRLAVVPGRGQYLTEQLYGLVRNGLGRDIIGSRDFLKFVPLLFSMFVLILLNNLFGIVPVIQFPTMSRFGFPAALALVVFVIYHAVGIRAKGLGGHFKHMIPPGLPWLVLILIVPLELLTYFFTRPVTLALRLFGNMFAGHLLLVLFASGGEYLILHSHVLFYVPVGAFSYVMAFVMTVFEILVEFLQAYIFTLLAALYIAGSLADDH